MSIAKKIKEYLHRVREGRVTLVKAVVTFEIGIMVEYIHPGFPFQSSVHLQTQARMFSSTAMLPESQNFTPLSLRILLA